MAPNEQDIAEYVLTACVQHGREMLATQMPMVVERGFDFMPSFQRMAVNLYLAGIMWRYGEQFEMPTDARDRGFICLISLLVSDGMPPAEAKEHVAYLNGISRTPDGKDNGFLAAGYRAQSADGSLVQALDVFRTNPEVSGAPYRLLDRTKPVAAILAIATLLASKLTGLGWGAAIGVGLVVGIAAMGIGLAIYRQMVKPSRNRTHP